MANNCPSAILDGCQFAQFLVNQTPKFDEMIMEDIRPTDGWMLNVSTGTVPTGTPPEVTQDRFRAVWPNTTKVWQRVTPVGVGCGTPGPCDPPEHQIGWGADRLTWYEEQQYWQTPIWCYDQNIQVTHAMEHIDQIINDILRPATTAITSNFLRKRGLIWAKHRWIANSTMNTNPDFTFQWTLTGPNNDDEALFDCNINPTNVFMLVPQMLQNRFSPLMRIGYAGKNPFKETAPFVEFVTSMDTCWFLDKLGGQQGVGGGNTPTVSGNWRFTQWNAANEYWRYGFSGQIGNYMVRVDELDLRFNFVADLGASANGGNGNRFRYQVVLPFRNTVTTGAGGAAGLGSEPNPDFDNAHFQISFIWHKKAMEILTREAEPLNPEMPFGRRDFGGKWQFVMDNLGADINGNVIQNKRRNKGQFISDFRLFVRPLHTEFSEVFFHKREQFCVPNVNTCSADPGYPVQTYESSLPTCPLPPNFNPLYGTGVPTGPQAGPVPGEPTAPSTPDE
jgi:hypothetical protein